MPDIRIISPSRMPGGITTEISSSRRSTPLPLHSRQISFGTSPVPRHSSQVLAVEMVPKMERFVSRIFPLPLQRLQVSIFVPGLAPFPPQVKQFEVLVIKIFRLVPKTASVKESWISVEMSRPRRASGRPIPPPKKSVKISFKLPKSPPKVDSNPPKLLKSQPEAGPFPPEHPPIFC